MSLRPRATPVIRAKAWCYSCRGLRPYALPLPAVKTTIVPLHREPDGVQVGEQIITLREGVCEDCGAPISRVGGGREPNA